MTSSIEVSAPGKLVLFGEHAVVYGRPTISTAVSQRLSISISTIETKDLVLSAKDVGIHDYQCALSDLRKENMPKGVRFVQAAVDRFYELHPQSAGVQIITSSEFSSLVGFGSSASVTACVLYGLSKIFSVSLSKKEIFDIGYQCILDVQGKGSGVDIASAIFGGTILYTSGGNILKKLSVTDLPIVVGYSGISSDTPTILRDIAQQMLVDSERIEALYDQMSDTTSEAVTALENQDWKLVGKCVNANQDLLVNLGVSCQELDVLIRASINAGSYGAKLSGAGRGDCMFALHDVSTKSDIVFAIESMGGEVIDIDCNVEGIRVET